MQIDRQQRHPQRLGADRSHGKGLTVGPQHRQERPENQQPRAHARASLIARTVAARSADCTECTWPL